MRLASSPTAPSASQVSQLTDRATLADKRRLALEKENIQLKQDSTDLRKSVDELECTVAKRQGDVEAESEERQALEKRFRDFGDAHHTIVDQQAADGRRITELEDAANRVAQEKNRVAQKKLSVEDFVFCLRTFGTDVTTVLQCSIWPTVQDFDSLKDMIDILDALANDQRVSKSEQWVSSAGTQRPSARSFLAFRVTLQWY